MRSAINRPTAPRGGRQLQPWPKACELSFEDVPEGLLRRFLNEIPTRFALDAEQVDRVAPDGRASKP